MANQAAKKSAVRAEEAVIYNQIYLGCTVRSLFPSAMSYRRIKFGAFFGIIFEQISNSKIRFY